MIVLGIALGAKRYLGCSEKVRDGTTGAVVLAEECEVVVWHLRSVFGAQASHLAWFCRGRQVKLMAKLVEAWHAVQIRPRVGRGDGVVHRRIGTLWTRDSAGTRCFSQESERVHHVDDVGR